MTQDGTDPASQPQPQPEAGPTQPGTQLQPYAAARAVQKEASKPRGEVSAFFNELRELAESAFRSRFFKSTDNIHQAIVKIQVGRELGIPPMRAISTIYIVNGNIGFAAGLIGSKVKSSIKYDYAITTLTNDACMVTFFENQPTGSRVQIGESSFTMEDATRAGLHTKDVWKNYPRNMLFARALVNGVRWFTPDIFDGPIYTPEEMGLAIDGNGEVIDEEIPQPIRTAWHREAAGAIYPHVPHEVVNAIKQAGQDPDVTAEMFDKFLIEIAKIHVITLPDHPEHGKIELPTDSAPVQMDPIPQQIEPMPMDEEQDDVDGVPVDEEA